MVLFGWFIPTKSGTVVGKREYSERGIRKETITDTNFNKGKQIVSVFTTAFPQTPGWSLIVRDADHLRTVEIFVSQWQFNNTKFGDAFTGVTKDN